MQKKQIFMPLIREKRSLVFSNLLYVALTRTKEKCFHIGDKDTVNRSIKKKENFKRNTFLLDIRINKI